MIYLTYIVLPKKENVCSFIKLHNFTIKKHKWTYKHDLHDPLNKLTKTYSLTKNNRYFELKINFSTWIVSFYSESPKDFNEPILIETRDGIINFLKKKTKLCVDCVYKFKYNLTKLCTNNYVRRIDK